MAIDRKIPVMVNIRRSVMVNMAMVIDRKRSVIALVPRSLAGE